MKWVAWKTIKEIVRETRTLIFLFLAPIIIMSLIYMVLSVKVDPKLGLVARGASRFFIGEFETALRNEDANIIPINIDDDVTDLETIRKKSFEFLENKTVDGILYLDQQLVDDRAANNRGNIYLFLQGTSSLTTASVLKAVASSMDDLNEAMPVIGDENCSMTCLDSFNNKTINLNKIYHYTNEDYEDIDYFIPFFPPFIVFFLTFITSTISFQRERTRGTLKYMLTTPLTLPKLYWGFNLGFSLFSIFQITVVMLFSLYLYGQSISIGNFLLWVFITLVTQQIALFIGLFCSLLSKTEFQAMQFIPIIILPQVFLSNMIWPLKNLSPYLHPIAHIMPLTSINMAISEVVLKQNSLVESWRFLLWPVAFLVLIILIFHIVISHVLSPKGSH